MTRHGLRTLIKQGHSGALDRLGYRADAATQATVMLNSDVLKIGDVLAFSCHVTTPQALPLLIDYRIVFARPKGKSAEKVFKLKAAKSKANETLTLKKKHHLKGDATTFKLYPGPHAVILQVNGADVARADFELLR